MERSGNTPRNLAASWRLNTHRLRLLGEICGECEEIMVYPRHVCPNCKATTVDENGKPKITIELDQTKSDNTIYSAPEVRGPRDQVLD